MPRAKSVAPAAALIQIVPRERPLGAADSLRLASLGSRSAECQELISLRLRWFSDPSQPCKSIKDTLQVPSDACRANVSISSVLQVASPIIGGGAVALLPQRAPWAKLHGHNPAICLQVSTAIDFGQLSARLIAKLAQHNVQGYLPPRAAGNYSSRRAATTLAVTLPCRR